MSVVVLRNPILGIFLNRDSVVVVVIVAVAVIFVVVGIDVVSTAAATTSTVGVNPAGTGGVTVGGRGGVIVVATRNGFLFSMTLFLRFVRRKKRNRGNRINVSKATRRKTKAKRK